MLLLAVGTGLSTTQTGFRIHSITQNLQYFVINSHLTSYLTYTSHTVQLKFTFLSKSVSMSREMSSNIVLNLAQHFSSGWLSP